jgi:signal transduction histidine kinase
MYSHALARADHDGDPAPPLIRRLAAHRFTRAQFVAIDAVAVALVVIAVDVVMTRRAPKVSGAAWDAAGWAAYVVAAAATLSRRRAPRLALAIVAPVAVVTLCLRAGGPTVFLAAMTLYSAAAVSSRRTASILAGLVASAILAATLAGGGVQVAQAAIGGMALVGLGWLAAENTRAGRVYAIQQAERVAEKEAAAAAGQAEQVNRALADERAQIARDLHDVVAHAMSVIAVRSEMRLLVGMLRDPGDRPAELSPVPGLADLDRLLADTAVAGVIAEVDIEGEVRPLPAAADLSAYRIVQEALTNVVRHAGPTHAQVRIGYRPGELDIEVIDDGPRGPRGPNDRAPRPIARAGGGHGLIGMRERAALFGGTLEAGPHAGGFRVRATLPIEEFEGAR